VNSDLVRDHLYAISFTTESPDTLHATEYTLRDSTDHRTIFSTGHDFEAKGVGVVGDGLLPLVFSHPSVTVDSVNSGYTPTSATNTRNKVTYNYSLSRNQIRPGFPEDIRIEFDDVVRDTGLRIGSVPRTPAKFRIFAETDSGDVQLDFRFRDINGDGTLSGPWTAQQHEEIGVVTYSKADPTIPSVTWVVELDTLGQGARGPAVPPRLGDVYRLRLKRPLNVTDQFVFSTTSAKVGPAAAANGGFSETPYVVPNPYVGAASFEPARYAVSGRGDRRLEFRAIPQGSTIRIYTVRGDLVQTLHQDGSTNGFVAWDLRTKDNLDVAPGLYLFQVDAPGVRPPHRQVRVDQMKNHAWVPLVAGVLGAALVVAPAVAQNKTGTAMGQFLLIEPDARIAGMGNAGVALARGLEGVYYNPAAIAGADRFGVSFTHSAWLAGITYDYAAAAMRVGGAGSAFVTITALNSGDIDVRTVSQPLGTGEKVHRVGRGDRPGFRAPAHRSVLGRRPGHLHAGNHLAQLGEHDDLQRRNSLLGVGDRAPHRREPLELRHADRLRRARPAHHLRQRPQPVRRQRIPAGGDLHRRLPGAGAVSVRPRNAIPAPSGSQAQRRAGRVPSQRQRGERQPRNGAGLRRAAGGPRRLSERLPGGFRGRHHGGGPE
jgi:hypothetical protein